MSTNPVKPTLLVCPECGVSMAGLDYHAHALTHFPEYLDPVKSSKLAIKRQKAILAGGVTQAEYEKAHKEE